MKMNKRMHMNRMTAVIAALLLMMTGAFSAAGAEGKEGLVVTTIFPICDWVREVAGDKAVEITMLLDDGVDLHSFQPSAQDILKVSNCDLFIYVGGESDEWVEDVLKTSVNKDLKAISLVQAMGDDIKNEEIVEGMEHDHDHEHEEGEEHDHEHEEGEEHDHEHEEGEEHDHEHEEGEEHDHEHEHEDEVDEHVWLSLRNAQKLVKVIADSLSEIDPEGADTYQANAAAYIEKLNALDAEYTAAVEKAPYKTVLFGDRFPFRYMTEDYGLDYYAAFSGCSAESEASFATVVFLAQKMDELGLPAILTIENPKTRIAQTVLEATQAKNQKILSMDSMQSTTSADIAAGATYLGVMEQNLKVLKEALGAAE